MLMRDNRTLASVYGKDDADLSQDARRLLALGADIPMCLMSASLRARGIGEKADLLTLPPLPAVLVNPRVSVSTADVFRALQDKENPPMPATLPDFTSAGSLIDWLCTMRNDLEGPAIRLQPVIAELLNDLRATVGCGLARMSGSGATCFGLFETADQAKAAAARIYDAHPGWWIAAGLLGDQSRLAMPKVSSPG
jgi:4-diphosphocytidyl-2-C-methyl-D-erythritol kinase